MVVIEEGERWEKDLRMKLLQGVYSLAKNCFGDSVVLGGVGLPWITVLPYAGAKEGDYLLSLDAFHHNMHCTKKVRGSAMLFAKRYEGMFRLGKKEEALLVID
ncbi:MAG: hypothetical protein KKF68_02630 [Nanoarchaeota archaeon]|nr:hypothetical protein [Nanoarchaeota archaeon]